MPFFAAWGLQAQGDLAWGRDDLDGAVVAFEAKAAGLAAARDRATPTSHRRPSSSRPSCALGPRGRGGCARGRRCAREAGGRGARGRWHGPAGAGARVADDDEAALEHFRARADAARREGTPSSTRAPTCASASACAGRAAAPTPGSNCVPLSPPFEALGAAPWADRASAELKATGETVRRRDSSSLDELTPQELRIALMLAEGATTRQAAAALYLSPKTVEYHLRHVYLKLGVNSRAALAAALGRARPGALATRAPPARG